MIKYDIKHNLTIKKVLIQEIPGFIDSDFYDSLNVKPISRPRAHSYFHNPRAAPNDPVIYMLFQKEQLIGFRTIMPDVVKLPGKEIKFGWCSGNWIDPKHRRKGYSKILLDSAYEDWQQKLMYTNFARESHLLYNKTSYFKILKKRIRTRFYGNIDVTELLKNRSFYKYLKPTIPLINIFFKLGCSFKRIFFRPHKLKAYSIFTEQHYQANFYVQDLAPESLFARSDAELQWMAKHPWLSDQPEYKKTNYPFSLFEADHKIWYLSIRKGNEVVGKLILSSRNGNLKLLYNFAQNISEIAAKAIANLCYENRMKTFSVMDVAITNELSKIRKPFIFNKTYQMGIYTTFEINENEQLYIHDGDGDYMFT